MILELLVVGTLFMIITPVIGIVISIDLRESLIRRMDGRRVCK